MKAIFLLLLCCSVCEAGLLLVPAPSVKFTDYHHSCRRDDYICSFDYLTKVLDAKPTPNLDDLIDHLNLNDRRSMDDFRNRLIHILNTEEISILQLEMLLNVLHSMNRTQPTVYFQMIEGELRRLSKLLHAPRDVSPAEFAFVFRTRFPLSKISSLRTDILKVPLYILHYSSLPLKSNTHDLRWPVKKPLVNGDCDSGRLAQPLARIEWKILTTCHPTIRADSESTPEVFRSGRQIL